MSRSLGAEVAERQFCTFYVEGLCFGIGVREVQEVIRYQGMTRVPLATSVVRGLINLRGQIVTAIDLRRRLGLPDRLSGDTPNPGAEQMVRRPVRRLLHELVTELRSLEVGVA